MQPIESLVEAAEKTVDELAEWREMLSGLVREESWPGLH